MAQRLNMHGRRVVVLADLLCLHQRPSLSLRRRPPLPLCRRYSLPRSRVHGAPIRLARRCGLRDVSGTDLAPDVGYLFFNIPLHLLESD